MDSRITLKSNESFLEILRNFQKAGTRVNLLVDEKGITRESGLIKSISSDEAPSIALEGGPIIAIKNIVAVNGIFHSQYSEC